MDSNTSTPKRKCKEMSFSPETSDLEDKWAKLLDQKLQPLHEKVDQVLSSTTHVKGLENEIKLLKSENQSLKEKIENLENYSRKNNIRLYNIPENKNEDIESIVIDLANRHLHYGQSKFNERTFKNVHRLGRAKSGITRHVIARFCNYKDKKLLLGIRGSLKERERISISDDYSVDTAQNRKEIFPAYKAIQEKLQESGESNNEVYLKQDKLSFKGKWFAVDELENLPTGFSPSELSTPHKNDITAFFSRRSPLSNHYKCVFKVKGETYNCLEQYLMIQKATLFGDQQSVVALATEQNPVSQKRIGAKIANFRKDVWKAEAGKILYEGLCAKFSQNPKLKEFLLETKDTELCEANPRDSFFGIGIGLDNPTIWDKASWTGTNLQGKTLQKVRTLLRG